MAHGRLVYIVIVHDMHASLKLCVVCVLVTFRVQHATFGSQYKGEVIEYASSPKSLNSLFIVKLNTVPP